MWIYSPCSAGSEGLTSESEEPSQDWALKAESALMWRGRRSPSRSWLARWRRALWMRRPFGRMCELSAPTFAPDPSTWSSVGSPAKTSRAPESGPVSGARSQGCSTSSLGSFASWSPDTSSWRTCEGSLFGESMPFSGSWPASGSMRSGRVFRRRMLAPLTSASGGSAWPTAKASQGGSEPDHARKKRGAGGPRLDGAAKAWPTPTARDWRDGDVRGMDVPTKSILGRTAPRWRGLQDKTTSTDGGDTSAKVVLNPRFVEALMGFPDGWTGLGR